MKKRGWPRDEMRDLDLHPDHLAAADAEAFALAAAAEVRALEVASACTSRRTASQMLVTPRPMPQLGDVVNDCTKLSVALTAVVLSWVTEALCGRQRVGEE